MGIFSQLAQSEMYYDESFTSPSSDDSLYFAAFGVIFLIGIVVLVITYIIHSFLLGRIFAKAGVKQWIAWVPFYNIWQIYTLGGQRGLLWTILLFIPIINIVAYIFFYIAQYEIGLKLQKEGWFVALALFVPIVWLVWRAFDVSKWDEGKAPEAKGAKESVAA